MTEEPVFQPDEREDGLKDIMQYKSRLDTKDILTAQNGRQRKRNRNSGGKRVRKVRGLNVLTVEVSHFRPAMNSIIRRRLLGMV